VPCIRNFWIACIYMKHKPKFVIYAPRYRSDSGGAIAMHKLCDVLNTLGYPSFLWPLWMPSSLVPGTLEEGVRTLAYIGSRLMKGGYRINSTMTLPWLTRKILKMPLLYILR